MFTFLLMLVPALQAAPHLQYIFVNLLRLTGFDDTLDEYLRLHIPANFFHFLA